jgi:hypothetical protein
VLPPPIPAAPAHDVFADLLRYRLQDQLDVWSVNRELERLFDANPDKSEVEVFDVYLQGFDPARYSDIVEGARRDMAKGYVICACGARITSKRMPKHLVSKAHLKEMERLVADAISTNDPVIIDLVRSYWEQERRARGNT